MKTKTVKRSTLRLLLQGVSGEVNGYKLIKDKFIKEEYGAFYRELTLGYNGKFYKIDYNWGDGWHTLLDKEEVCIYEIIDKKESLKLKLKEESKYLIEKSDKLHSFLSTKNFYKLDRSHKDLLYTQFRLMNEYIQVLGQRMELLGVDDFK